MDSRLLYAFITYYDNPSEIIDELNLSHQEVLELLWERYREDVFRLINDRFMGDFEVSIDEVNLDYLKWGQ